MKLWIPGRVSTKQPARPKKPQEMSKIAKAAYIKAKPKSPAKQIQWIRKLASTGVKCAIVGNASSIVGSNQGKVIDSFDIVVRINTFTTIYPEHQGSKTDIVFAHQKSMKTVSSQQPTCPIVNTSDQIPRLLDFWTEKLRADVGDEKARPTTGFLAITYMLDAGAKVTLFGFDFFKTPTLYTQTPAWRHHYPEWEQVIVDDLLTHGYDYDQYKTLNQQNEE